MTKRHVLGGFMEEMICITCSKSTHKEDMGDWYDRCQDCIANWKVPEGKVDCSGCYKLYDENDPEIDNKEDICFHCVRRNVGL